MKLRARTSLSILASIVVPTLTLAGCGSAGGRYAADAARVAPAHMQPSYAPPPGSPPASSAYQPQAAAVVAVQAEAKPAGTEHYEDYGVNPVTDPKVDRFSTFAIDVDTASYAISRRKLNEGTLPAFASVRAEEYLNYFGYDYAPPARGAFAVHLSAAPSPYDAGHHLVRVGLQAKRIAPQERMPVHLVYLVDTSGSMMAPDRIELAKKGLKMLTDALKPGDTVALCTYAGSVREVLSPTGIGERARILSAIDSLTAGGSTAMSSGIQLAYSLASRTLVKGHVNRVVVLSDGDANVGSASHEEILKSISEYRGKGITLSTVGFGSGNYKDVMMEQLADKGDGNYTYIDSLAQARRVFAEQTDGLLQVVARDVKIQVEFDPNVVRQYRLIGYENRDIKDKDFRNDKVDAGEVGAGHSVTAMYDVVLARTDQDKTAPVTVRVRHKMPLGDEKAEESVFAMPASAVARSFDAVPEDFRFAAGVAGFAEILRHSPAAREWRLVDVERIASSATKGKEERTEFLSLVQKATRLSGVKSEPVASQSRR